MFIILHFIYYVNWDTMLLGFHYSVVRYIIELQGRLINSRVSKLTPHYTFSVVLHHFQVIHNTNILF